MLVVTIQSPNPLQIDKLKFNKDIQIWNILYNYFQPLTLGSFIDEHSDVNNMRSAPVPIE